MPRPFQPSDLDALLAINNANAPAVNALSAGELGHLLAISTWTRVVDDEAGPAGFLLGLHGPGLPYPSENYRWFSEKYDDFLYVDRVAVSLRAQGQGIGSRLYHAFIDHARTLGLDTVCAEVNLRPANPGSVRFHERFGFTPLGEQETKEDSVRVRLFEYKVAKYDLPADAT
jgi:predicted GNAT superfamily acetyltransferase